MTAKVWALCPLWGTILVIFLLGGLGADRDASAESAFDLLSGFDGPRLSQCYPVDDSASAGEMAKLLFRLRKADEKVIASRSAPLTDDVDAGDVVQIAGTITAVRQYKVPEALIEFLDLTAFQEIVLASEQSEKTLSVFAPPLVGKVSEGDLIKADAIVLNVQDSECHVAAGNIAWIPASAESIGWRLLARQGVDLARVAEAASRDRRSLEAADGDAFYSMLAAAKKLDTRELGSNQELPAPIAVEPVQLLQSPGNYHGQWVRIKTSTVRVTRVSVTEPLRREQLGQDHYFQIDSSGDLGKTIIQLERAEGDSSDPILMSGSYPVSLVAAVLPDFLEEQLEDKNAVVSMVSLPVSIDGFFYRLWSYQNEFMTREGGGKQVGPLIVVSHWRSMVQPEPSRDGVEVIGYLLAVGILTAIIGTIWWTRRNTKEDAQIRDQTRGATTIEL